MKKFKMFIASIICLAMFGGMAMAQERGNVGFGFGTAFHKHQNAMLKTAGMNFFRLYLKAEEGVHFFLHTESGNFNVDEGDIDANADQRSEAIGMSIDLGVLNLDVLIGTSTLKVNGNLNAGNNVAVPFVTNTAQIRDVATTDPFAEIAARFSYVKNNASLDLSLAYRYHKLGKDIEYSAVDFIPATAEDVINDMSSLNMSVGISYLF